MTSAERFILVLLAFILSTNSRQIASAVTPGSSFTPQRNGDFWLSENRSFTFGFREVGSNQHILSIWVSGDTNKTAIWWATFGENSTIDADAILNFTDGGNIELLDSTMAVVWSSKTSNRRVSSAKLLDTGNLVLYNASNGTVWQSFQYPTDTLVLPNEGQLTGPSLQSIQPYLLQSRQNVTSFAQGGYSLQTDSYGNLFLGGVDQRGNSFRFWYAQVNTTGDFQIQQNNVVVFSNSNYSVDQSVLKRLTLDYDGNLRVYSFKDSNSSSWQLLWEAIDDQCKIGSPCGPFGLCEVVDQKINCTCPPDYLAIDDRDLTQGCAAKVSFNITCSVNNGSNYNTTMVVVNNFDYDFDDLFPSNVPTVDENTCKNLCLQECSCMAASYRIDGSALCFLKGNNQTGYLLMGYQTPNNDVFVKVATASGSPRVSSGGGEGKTGVAKAVGIPVAVVAATAVALGAAVWWYRRKRGGGARGGEEEDELVSGGGPVRFTYEELLEATNNFGEPLGEGAFGKVYKGWMAGRKAGGSARLVAVKVLNGGEGGGGPTAAAETERQFRAEVATLGKIHHINLVRLFGFCTGGGRRLLVYEYMPNGSLDKFVCRRRQATETASKSNSSAASMPPPSASSASNSSASSAATLLHASAAAPSAAALPWRTRFSIALGTARGISYLHHDCHQSILHCDIKPQNILLDGDFSPKVADFGLAKLFPHRDDHLSMSAVRGTRGYLAPEWLASDEITAKADVYSFGMVLLELVRGHNTEFDHLHLQKWAYESISSSNDSNNTQQLQEDEDRESGPQATQEQQRVLKIGLWCIQHSPSLRPNMPRVIHMLEGTVPVDDPPFPAPIDPPHYALSQPLSSYQDSYSLLSVR